MNILVKWVIAIFSKYLIQLLIVKLSCNLITTKDCKMVFAILQQLSLKYFFNVFGFGILGGFLCQSTFLYFSTS